MRDIESPDHQGTRTFCKENGTVHQHLPNASKMKKKKEQKVISHDNKRYKFFFIRKLFRPLLKLS